MPDLIYEKANGIVCLTLNRPEKRNAMSPQMFGLLADAWVDFRDDPDARVAILTGAGTKAFSAGADLALSIPLLSGAREPEDEWDERFARDPSVLQTAVLRRFELYKPVIAAVNGMALAGGTEILQGTDIRLAVPEASFGLSEVKRGVVPGGGSLVRLARQMPYAKAMELLLVGDAIGAGEALLRGFVNEIVPAEKLLDRAYELAGRIAENGPLAVQACKEAVVRSSGLSLADAYDVEDAVAARVLASEDAREGPRAFVEKRKPVFRGR